MLRSSLGMKLAEPLQMALPQVGEHIHFVMLCGCDGYG
jgi:hypothetical protein